MESRVTISKRTYESLRKQAAAWRRAIGSTRDSVVFNAVRDNGGNGIEAAALAEKLRTLVERD